MMGKEVKEKLLAQKVLRRNEERREEILVTFSEMKCVRLLMKKCIVGENVNCWETKRGRNCWFEKSRKEGEKR